MTDHPALPDLAKLPRPDRRGEPAASFGQDIAPLVSSRGCYANCSFCCIAASARGRELAGEDVPRVSASGRRRRGNGRAGGRHGSTSSFHARRRLLSYSLIAETANTRRARRRTREPGASKSYANHREDAPDGLRLPRYFPFLEHRLKLSSRVHQHRDGRRPRIANAPALRHTRGDVAEAINIIRNPDLYPFLLHARLRSPDTTIESLRTNIEFLRYSRGLRRTSDARALRRRAAARANANEESRARRFTCMGYRSSSPNRTHKHT